MKIAFYVGTSDDKWKAVQQWAIRLWTLGKYNHCELIDDHGSDDPTKWTWFTATTYNTGLTRAATIDFKPDHWHVYDLPKDVDYLPAISFMVKELDKKYDWLGIFLSQFLRINVNNPHRWFCSEYNAAALQHTALFRGDTTPAQAYSPNRLYRKLKTMGEIKKWQK